MINGRFPTGSSLPDLAPHLQHHPTFTSTRVIVSLPKMSMTLTGTG